MEETYAHQLHLVGYALAAAPCPACAHVGQVVGRLLAQPEPCVRLVHAYVRVELCGRLLSPSTPALTRLAWLVGAAVAPLDATGARLDAAWFATLVGPQASADTWAGAFGAYPTLGAYRGDHETLVLTETERAALWMLLAERRARQPPGCTDVWTDTDDPDTLRYDGGWPVKPFMVTVARHGLAGCTTTYRLHFVRLPRTLVRTVVAPLYCAISAGEGAGLLQWVTPDQCTFVTTLHPLWTRRAGIVRGTDCVHDEWDGFDWTLAHKQMHLEQVSPLCTTLWDTLEAWQGAGAPAWNYATLLEYAPTFAEKDSEDTYQPLTSVVLADDSLVVCVNLSPQPLRLCLRRYRGNETTPPHRSTLGQGDAFVGPQAMLPLLEVAVSDPALADAKDGADTGGTGAMLLMLHSAHTFTHYTRAEVHTILHDQLSSSSPDTDADTTAVTLAPSPTQRVRATVSAGAGAGAGAGAQTGNGAEGPLPHPSPALGIKTVVHAPPHVCQLHGRARGRTRGRAIVQLPVVHQLVGVHGRRFARNPKTKHWFAIVRTVNTTTGSVRVDYVNEEAFDDIDQPSDLLFPVDDTMLGGLERFVADDPAYAQVWRLVRDHVAQVRTLEEATQRAASPSPSPSPTRLPRTIRTSPCKASPPPSMRPVHATRDQWCIQPQSTTMGDGLWVVRGPRHALFEYTVHACDIDHLVTLEAVDDALDTCAIVMRSAPDATTNVLAPRGAARGPGSYANAVDYRWDAEASALVYVPKGEGRTHQANAELLEYDGKVYLRLTDALEGSYAMVEYGEAYVSTA